MTKRLSLNMKIEFEWKSPDIIPGDYQSPILCMTGNRKLMTLKDTMGMTVDHTQKSGYRYGSNWSWYVEKYNIKYWCYQSELVDITL